ncbi:MAG: polysaccharide deacetylase family protein [Saprospiraceae bacterium]|nr:polysaccharide deacetylase family protein [Saprospiraceae bacterium]
MYFVKTPSIIQSVFAGLIWRISKSKKVYLTFDDGPVPEATPWVLDLLKKHGCKATFFCVGENVEKYPQVYQRIVDEGHAVGNHTFNHLNAWKSEKEWYKANVAKASEYINSSLFRPPYGKLTPGLIKKLKGKFDIIMWDVLSGDFDTTLSPQNCFENVKSNAKEGSIIVFHDSIKAIDTLKIVLPQVIAYFEEKGIQMDKISQ